MRDADSDADEQFVAELCRMLGLDLSIGQPTGDLASEATGDGLEAAARDARYRFLQSEAERLGARYVVTAHTADDQAETVLHRIVRGTGVAGLAGIPRCRALGPATSLLRPMLGVRRATVVDYLRTLGQTHRDDASNAETTFTRNRIRHSLLPLLARDYNPQVVDALLRLGALAADVRATIDAGVAALADRTVTNRGSGGVAGGVEIDCAALAGQTEHLVRELFVDVWRRRGWPERAMGYEHWTKLASQAMSAADRPAVASYPGGVVATRSGSMLRLERRGGE